jgi:hypothetical protein
MTPNLDLAATERELAGLDAVYRPVATKPIDVNDPAAFQNMGVMIESALAQLGVQDRAEALLRRILALYVAGGDATRVAIRRLFDRYRAFRWAAHLPRDWGTAEEFRARIVHLSARDQGADARDEILALQDLCDRARRAGVDIEPILDEAAGLSSDEDRYGMGSMRSIFHRYGGR